MRHVRSSRSFIGPEVGLPCFPCNLANALPELLMAQGVIIGHGVGVGTSRGPEVNHRKRARQDGSSGPSKRHTGPMIKKEEIPVDARALRIQALQVSRVN